MIGTDIYQIHLSFNQNVAPSAGQFYMLILFGIGEAPFSVADVFPEKNEVVFAIRNVGNVTNKISQLKEGEQIGIKGPFGKPWPVPSHGKKNCLILAGGIGIIPMRLFIRQLIQKKNNLG